MPCDLTYRELDAYATGDVDAARRDSIQRHILNCYRCQRRLEALGVVDAVLRVASPIRLPMEAIRASVVWAAINRLPDRQQRALAMHAFEKWDYRQIADVLQMPTSTAESLVHRARGNLAEALAGQPAEVDRPAMV